MLCLRLMCYIDWYYPVFAGQVHESFPVQETGNEMTSLRRSGLRAIVRQDSWQETSIHIFNP